MEVSDSDVDCIVQSSGRIRFTGSLDADFRDIDSRDATKEDFEGQGLGLALVKRLCDQLDWHVRLTSELGKGTTVTIDCFPHQGRPA